MFNRFFSTRANNTIRRYCENVARHEEPARDSIATQAAFITAHFTLVTWFLNRLDGLSWRQRLSAEAEQESTPVFPRCR